MPWNFSAGPSALPAPVLERAREELLIRDKRGSCLLERSFTGAEFVATMTAAEAGLRELLAVPDEYAVLFLSGGAMAQFGLLPMNLARPGQPAAYVESGYWSGRAIEEARHFCSVSFAARHTVRDGVVHLPPPDEWRIDPDAAYCHYTANETAQGAEFHIQPDSGLVPLVADMSSNILSRRLDVSRFGVIYASAQKNLGASGLTLALVRRDLLSRSGSAVPSSLSYRIQAAESSRYSTPPVFEVALVKLVFDWLRAEGGMPAMEVRSLYKSDLLYRAIDDSAGFYRCFVAPANRSRMNVCFRLGDEALTESFVADAEAEGLFNLRGHSRVGGIRVSLYNAVPEAAVHALLQFMDHFAARHG